MSDLLYSKDELTLTQLKSTMRKLKKHAHLGLYLVVEDITQDHIPRFSVELWGPKLTWHRRMKEEWFLDVTN